MISAPCATLITRMTPKPRASPLAIRAYTPPVRRPRMQAWTKTCMRRVLASPGRLRRERLRDRDLRREDREQLALHPLDEQVLPVRLAVGVPGQVPLDRRPRALVQGRDDRLVVDRVRLGDGELEQLA